MKKISILLFALVMVSSLFIGCQTKNNSPEGGASDNAGQPEIDFSKMIEAKGSDTMVNLGQRWAEEFMGKYPKAQVAVTGGGSGTGIEAIINGTTDIALSSRTVKDEEIAQAKANGRDLKIFVPGKDGIAIAVHKDNKIENLTMEQLKDIFTGSIKNWKDVGGADADITIYSRESNSGTYAFVKEFVLGNAEYAQEALLMPSTGAIVEGLKQDKNGIGYIGLGYLSDEVKAVPVSKSSDSKASLPSKETVVSGEYPVARDLFVITAGEPEGVIGLYMDFIMGDEGQEVVDTLGFIPVK